MRILTGLQDTQYYEPDSSMDWAEDLQAEPLSGIVLMAAGFAAALPSSCTSGSTDAPAQPRPSTSSGAKAIAYEEASAQAKLGTGGGMGWVPAQVMTDECGYTYNLDRALMVYAVGDNASLVPAYYDESGTVCLQPEGQWLEFDQATFDAQYDAAAPMDSPLAVFAKGAAMAASAGSKGSIGSAADLIAGIFSMGTANTANTANASPVVPPVFPTVVDAPAVAVPARIPDPVPSVPTAPMVAVAVTAMPSPAAASAALKPSAGTYVGEALVDPSWLQRREAAFVAVRADYVAARSRAQLAPGVAPGWYETPSYFDDSNRSVPSGGGAPIFVPLPNSDPEIIGNDDNGPIYKPAGQWFEFDEATFAENYKAQSASAKSPMQALAACYGTDARNLLASQPDLWHLIISDHALNAGAAPSGQAMGNAAQIGELEFYMADPLIAALINAFGSPPPPAIGPAARDQVRLFGPERYVQLGRLANAMQSVRDQYASAFRQAQASGEIGWTQVPRMGNVVLENGSVVYQQLTQWNDETGSVTPIFDSAFDAQIFTQWYESQSGIQNQVFAEIYGGAQSGYSTDESGHTFLSDVSFENTDWAFDVHTGLIVGGALVALDLNHPADLIDDQAIGFDPYVGFGTLRENLRPKGDGVLDELMPMLIIGAITLASASTLGPYLAGAMGVSGETGVAVVSAAVGGATSSALNGFIAGHLNFGDIFTSALSGAFTAGVMGSLNYALDIPVGSVGTIALRSTVQGGIQMLMGGKFANGALAGFASGLAEVVGPLLLSEIKSAIGGTMTASEALSARMFTRIFTSAIVALGDPNHPLNAFASAFMGNVLGKDATPSGKRDGDVGGTEAVVGKPVPTPGLDLPNAPATPPDGEPADEPAVDTTAMTGGPTPPSDPDPEGSVRNASRAVAADGLTLKNGTYIPATSGGISGSLRSDPTAPAAPDIIQTTTGSGLSGLSPYLDDAGRRWYVDNGTGLAVSSGDLLSAARQITIEGVGGLQDGSVTPSEYLAAVRFIENAGLEPQGSIVFITLPPVSVSVAVTDAARQSAALQDQALRIELAQLNISPIDESEHADEKLTRAQAVLLSQTRYLFNEGDAERLSEARDAGKLLSLAAVGTAGIPLSFGSLVSTAAELTASAEAAIGPAGLTAGRVLVATSDMIEVLASIVVSSPPIAAALALLVMPANAGQVVIVSLNGGDQRIVTRPGDLYGNLEEIDSNGKWTVSKSDVVLVNLGANRVVALTQDELRQLTRPSISPATPMPPAPPMINIPVPDNEIPSPALPGPSTDQPAQPIAEIYPADPPMTWEDLITEKRDSTILGDNLRSAGEENPGDNYDAHHIIASRARGADYLRLLLQNAGIDLNSAENGVWLPSNERTAGNGETPHNETLRDSYYEYLLAEFRGTDGSVADIKSRLASIKQDLRDGKVEFQHKGS